MLKVNHCKTKKKDVTNQIYCYCEEQKPVHKLQVDGKKTKIKISESEKCNT